MIQKFSDDRSSGVDFIRLRASQAFFETNKQPTERKLAIATLVIGLLMPVYFLLSRNNEVLPVVNRLFRLEPRVFARFRWAFNSKRILEDADEKVKY